MRPHRRRQPLNHVLIAGDLHDLDTIRPLLALLPDDTYGQVFVAGASPDTSMPLLSPARVTVSWLGAQPGALGLAIAGWMAEWMPDEPQPDREITVWIGGRAGEQISTLCDVLGVRAERL